MGKPIKKLGGRIRCSGFPCVSHFLGPTTTHQPLCWAMSRVPVEHCKEREVYTYVL